nr:HAD family hydrolase [Paenibacillus caui]
MTRDIYLQSFKNIFLHNNIQYDYKAAVDHLFEEHRASEFYEETEAFLEFLLKKVKVCIVSDTDEQMLPPFYKKYPIQVFTSEQFKSYKNDQANKMFTEIIKYYEAAPENILHIGDSPADVLGAKRAGIKAVWLNRTQANWNHEVKPDYTVRRLDEIPNNIL